MPASRSAASSHVEGWPSKTTPCQTHGNVLLHPRHQQMPTDSIARGTWRTLTPCPSPPRRPPPTCIGSVPRPPNPPHRVGRAYRPDGRTGAATSSIATSLGVRRLAAPRDHAVAPLGVEERGPSHDSWTCRGARSRRAATTPAAPSRSATRPPSTGDCGELSAHVCRGHWYTKRRTPARCAASITVSGCRRRPQRRGSHLRW